MPYLAYYITKKIEKSKIKNQKTENQNSKFKIQKFKIQKKKIALFDQMVHRTFELSKKSAERNNPNGINRLGYCYDNGIGIEVNSKRYLNYIKR